MIARYAFGVLAAVALVLGAAAPAQAVPDPAPATAAQAAPSGSVLVSTDGVTFSSDLPGGLFPAETVLIPGADKAVTLYVKNDSTVPSELFVSASDVVVSSPDFARSLSVRAVSSSTPAGPPVPLDFGTGCAVLLAEPLAPGAVTRLSLRLEMSDVPGQVAQGGSLAANLGLALVESDTSTAPATACAAGIQLPVIGTPAAAPGASLAFTGSTILYPALMAVCVLLGVGVWLVFAGRRGRHAR